MLKHHSEFFTFESSLERARRNLRELSQGPMWYLPVVLVKREPLDSLVPYFTGYPNGDILVVSNERTTLIERHALINVPAWHDGNRDYSPNDLFEIYALSVAALRSNSGELRIPETLSSDPTFRGMNWRSQSALVTIHWLVDTFTDWLGQSVAGVVYLPKELSREEDWPWSSAPDQEEIDAGGSWGEYEWVDDFSREYYWWDALRMREWITKAR